MPGIIGGVSVPRPTLDLLEREFLARWPSAAVERRGDSMLGGHAYGDSTAVFGINDHVSVAVDGEWSLYREAAVAVSAGRHESARSLVKSAGFDLASTGNLAVVDHRAGSVTLAVDPSGAFPLYYSEHARGLLFGNLLRLLAGATAASWDDLGILEFLRQAYTVNGKTLFEGIRRLLPGQVLTFRNGSTVTIQERSTAWAGIEHFDEAAAADHSWTGLTAAVRRSRPSRDSALMMSGGWDSRSLLGAMNVAGVGMVCYSHGDTESRELTIVRRLADALGVPYRLEPIDDRIIDPDLLRRGFERTENVVFPHWHRAGRILAGENVGCVTAGVFGEVLGGHYGPAMTEGTFGKIKSIGGSLLRRGARLPTLSSQSAQEYLRTPRFGRHWYLSEAFEGEIVASRERMDAAIEGALRRLAERGVHEPSALVEAFITEHRGAQYINAQLLSCRASIDIATPFAGREIFALSTRIPLDTKIHNSLNRRMLARWAPELLRVPLAATLLPARYPVLALEASRGFRKVLEAARAALSTATGGVVRPARMSWANFEFLRDGTSFLKVVEDLRCDIWNREEMRKQIAALTGEPRSAFRPGPLLDQLSKVYTVDLMLRK